METREEMNARKVRERKARKERLGILPWDSKRVCNRCQTEYQPNSPTQKYCGSQINKEGCSQLIAAERTRISKTAYRKKSENEIKIKVKSAEYRRNNADLIRVKSQEYYLKNRNTILLRNKNYWKQNPDRKREYKIQRRALEYEAEGSHTTKEWELVKLLFDYRCAGCFRREPEITLTEDHKIPLSKGGTNYIDNIQPLCITCNSSKATRTWFAQCPLFGGELALIPVKEFVSKINPTIL